MSLTGTDTAGMRELVRYQLTIDNMDSADCIGWVRERLTGLGLIVDQVAVGKAEVATAHVDGPDLKAIKVALETGGYRLVQAVTKVG